MKRWKALLTAMTLCVGMSGIALAQDRDHDRHVDRDDHRGNLGWRQDRDHDRDDRDRDHNVYYGNHPYVVAPRPYVVAPRPYVVAPYGFYDGGPSVNGAAQIGYQDGFNDGRNDAATGHSFRPTQDSNYRHAGNGYNGAYTQAYREAYLQGYQNGYGR